MWFALIHSPLVGPFTWKLTALALRRREQQVIVPALRHSTISERPYWQQHTDAVTWALSPVSDYEPLVLVAHSGAGVLLPAIRQALGRPVNAYLLVDALIPQDGQSRLDLFDAADEVEAFRQSAVDGLLPTWTEIDLQDAITDDEVRSRFVSELRPLPLAVYEEPIPVFEGWPDAPCGYVQFSAAYDGCGEAARQAGWAYRRMEGTHFQMLNKPAAVAMMLLEMMKQV